MTPRQAIDPSWAALLDPAQPAGIGYDIATSEAGAANPSAAAVLQPCGGRYVARLIVAWKSAEPAVAWGIFSAILDDMDAARVMRRRMQIDASNEVFHARQTKGKFSGRCPVRLVKGAQKMKYRGEDIDAKTLLGNLFVNALEDGIILLPGDDFVSQDFRLVQREGGRFVTLLGPGGQHGDTFDACKHAYFSLLAPGGDASGIRAVPVGSFGMPAAKDAPRPGLHTKGWVRARARHSGRLA